MRATDTIPELKQILGAMIFGANRPLSIKEMRKCLLEVAENERGPTAAFAQVKPSEIAAAVEELAVDLVKTPGGFLLKEVSGGFRLQSDPACGRWLKHLLDKGRPRRLSMPALETLAIIAYRQPVSRSDIEGVRGVSVDHVIKLLMELHLVRIAGRSDLPGRPFLYATTRTFLDHFGLRDLKDLESIQPGMLAARQMSMSRRVDAEDEPVEENPATDPEDEEDESE
jgi:segregation and condensation protein B